MKRSSLLGHIIQLLDLLREGRQPADVALAGFFKARHYLGSKDRRHIAEQVYDLLRNYRLSEWHARRALAAFLPGISEAPSAAVYAAYAARVRSGADPLIDDFLAYCLEHPPTFDCESLLAALRAAPTPSDLIDDAAERLALEFSFPTFVVAGWLKEFGEEETLACCRALNRQAPLAIRVNLLRCSIDQCRSALEQAGVGVLPPALSPCALLLDRRINAQSLEPFRAGWFEMQDEGSQLLSLLLEPKEGMLVVDACAGGGGKTLHIASLMQNRGSVVAIDTHAERLNALSARSRRAGAVIAQVLLAGRDAAAIRKLRGRADAVLVDAPCSGTGTLRRNPALKMRLDETTVRTLADRQGKILAEYSRLVRPGGRLVYATCSLLREENDEVVGTFLSSETEFTLLPAVSILQSGGITLPNATPYLRLLPHKVPTDGFFAAVMERRGVVDS